MLAWRHPTATREHSSSAWALTPHHRSRTVGAEGRTVRTPKRSIIGEHHDLRRLNKLDETRGRLEGIIGRKDRLRLVGQVIGRRLIEIILRIIGPRVRVCRYLILRRWLFHGRLRAQNVV